MRYSIEPRERKSYGFLSFARKFGNEYGKKDQIRVTILMSKLLLKEKLLLMGQMIMLHIMIKD